MRVVRLVASGFALAIASPAFASDDIATVESFRHCDACPDMIAIPAGSFVIGASEAETAREKVPDAQAALERPQRRITISRPFALGMTEVTVDQYAAFARDTGRSATACQVFFKDEKFTGWLTLEGSGWDAMPFPQQADHPVACVTWQDATAYADWLSGKTGKRYRLPSEAEWEYAARAGTQTARYWGEVIEDACRYASVSGSENYRQQFACTDGFTHTAPATYGIANAFGLRGMLGNIGEWVEDCAIANYAEIPADGSPWRGGECTEHVGRGGSWWNDPYYIRAARRFYTSVAYYILGFRVAMELD